MPRARAGETPTTASACACSPAGKLTFANARAGRNRIVFQGRIAGAKRLRPGRYTVVLTATNAGGRSAPLSLSFTIAPH